MLLPSMNYFNENQNGYFPVPFIFNGWHYSVKKSFSFIFLATWFESFRSAFFGTLSSEEKSVHERVCYSECICVQVGVYVRETENEI